MKKTFRQVAVLAFLCASAFAQLATTTAVVGNVVDSSGRAIASAKVTLVETRTLATLSTVTNDQGYYSFEFIPAGQYSVTVELPGFQKTTKTGIPVSNNQAVRSDITLQVGQMTQSVTVQAENYAIKTDDATLSEVLGTRAVSELPLSGRDPMMLAVTTPGVLLGTKSSATGIPPGNDFVGAGTREIQNSMSLDGISIMNNLITTSPTQPMVETVQEVEVQTGTYSAQYGAYLGVHLNMVTKGGSNALHGNVVEFIRNDAFDARGFFLPATSKKTALRQNQYGFEVDGPVVLPKIYNGRDKTFFMGSWERLRNKRQSLSANNTVMTERMFAGDFSQTPTIVRDPLNGNQPFPGNIVPKERLSPIAIALQQYYVTPTDPSKISQNFTNIFPATLTSDQTVDRVDQNIGYKAR